MGLRSFVGESLGFIKVGGSWVGVELKEFVCWEVGVGFGEVDFRII